MPVEFGIGSESGIGFEVGAERAGGGRRGVLRLPHGDVQTPVFMPVGTAATVKTVEQGVLERLGPGAAGAQILLANTYHLYLRPGHELVRRMGGVHRFMSWERPLLTDSGGFQVFSLAKLRKVTEDGVEFRSHIDGSKHFFSPEHSMAVQIALGADVMMAFDECVETPATWERTKQSMGLTHAWARRSMEYWKAHRHEVPWAAGGLGGGEPTLTDGGAVGEDGAPGVGARGVGARGERGGGEPTLTAPGVGARGEWGGGEPTLTDGETVGEDGAPGVGAGGEWGGGDPTLAHGETVREDGAPGVGARGVGAGGERGGGEPTLTDGGAVGEDGAPGLGARGSGAAGLGAHPLLFGIVQGGMYKDLRADSAEQLVAMDFPGYAIGGLAVGEPREVTREMIAHTLEFLPKNKPRYVMGVGYPDEIEEYARMGVDMMDCVLPTRAGRHGLVFAREDPVNRASAVIRLNIKRKEMAEDAGPIDAGCGCPVCQRYSRAYLRHLYASGEALGASLNTVHNLYFYLETMERVRGELGGNPP